MTQKLNKQLSNQHLDKDLSFTTSSKTDVLLMQILFEKAKFRGDTINDLAKEFGLTYGYLIELVQATRAVSGLTNQVCREIAEYLEVPAILILLLADKVGIEDMLIPGERGISAFNSKRMIVKKLKQDLVQLDIQKGIPDTSIFWMGLLYKETQDDDLLNCNGFGHLMSCLTKAAILVNDAQLNR